MAGKSRCILLTPGAPARQSPIGRAMAAMSEKQQLFAKIMIVHESEIVAPPRFDTMRLSPHSAGNVGRPGAETFLAQLIAPLRGNRLLARAARSSLWIALGYGASQALRLASNLILTRLLFPEAFGLMALVTVFMVGLAMFSDIGLGPAVSQHRRGDDPDFLDTGWTLQVIRGVCLWLVTCALAWPAALLYGEPLLARLLPVAGLALLIAGFNPTRILTAHRNLGVGRLTALDLLSQAVGLAAMVALALMFRSVWALVIGGLVGTGAKLVLTHLNMLGHRNRLRWEPSAARELVRFGKWIFLSTALGFFMTQGDKAILGKYLTMQGLGIYNIGYFLASFPTLLGMAVVSQVMIPLYRERPPWEGRGNYLKLRRMRMLLTGAILSMLIVLAFCGVPLVGLLYDARYQAAGGIVVAIACIQMFALIGMTYDQAALAAGQSRGYFLLFVARATLQIGGLLIGAHLAGLGGALAGQGAAILAAHPFVIALAARHRAWDGLHDLGYALIAAAAVGGALWLNWPAMLALWGGPAAN